MEILEAKDLIAEILITNTDSQKLVGYQIAELDSNEARIIYLEELLRELNEEFELHKYNVRKTNEIREYRNNKLFEEFYKNSFDVIYYNDKKLKHRSGTEENMTDLDFIYELRMEHIELKIYELDEIRKTYIPQKIKLLQDDKIKYYKKEKSKDENLGLNYIVVAEDPNSEISKERARDKKQDSLLEFLDFLVENEFIEKMNPQTFCSYFNEYIKTDKPKIKWVGKEYELAALIRLLIDINNFEIPKNNYTHIIKNIFIKENLSSFDGSRLRNNHTKPKSQKSNNKLKLLISKSKEILESVNL